MSRHDEPNEYGFAGEATAPEPPEPAKPDERDRAEAVAVPGDDLTTELSEALSEPEEAKDREQSHGQRR